ncbi:flagellar biosynthesis protein [Anoxybacillus calidus]|jgi:flagellar biosynthesis protein|uniref:Flagellar biosynthesis protein n=1 Tax=[Anoxybacillus] calidus TaxID=575178 RepID=A0A7W0BW89_9BACL|nr:EscU/YscU/HrcU family type III secretion system export apparatus switch protein [Anoxybacillus calidus]MBA2870789.1 flagellar biosynthesis protein [Anoxybacillus calidus]
MNEKQKVKQAIALTYRPDRDGAPIVTAKGKGYVAEKIIETAKEHQVPIQEDASLVEMLSKLQINETIPEELYQVVAEVFAFVYRVEKQLAKK